MLREDTKKFYRNLGMKNIEAREPPSMAEAETYWKSIWGEEAQRNERNEWIRKEKKRKLVIWIGCLYGLRKLIHIFLKLKIGNSLEVIKYKITGLKLFHLLTGISQ